LAFDDIVVTAPVPEPINWAVACFGFSFVCGLIGRSTQVRFGQMLFQSTRRRDGTAG
jgi:hypothetical protein